MHRRDFVKTTVQGIAVATTPMVVSAQPALLDNEKHSPPAVHTRRARPLCIADVSSIRFTNGGSESAITRAFRGISSGEDVLDAIVAGVNIPELDPEERGIGYGGLPNADGIVQLDSCLMHGPKKWAGGVAGIEGVKTPSLIAKAVAELTDHHLIVGQGAQDFARALGFEIHEDLNTEASRALWLEWRRRVDPSHWLDPEDRGRRVRSNNQGAVFVHMGTSAGFNDVPDFLLYGDVPLGDGTFEGRGSSGMGGAIPRNDMATSLRAGYATAGSDTGHEGDARFALDQPEKIIDFFYSI